MTKTKTTFTPGPWRAEPEDRAPDRGDVYIGGPKGWRHQPIAACCFPRDIEEAKANAALIAAAPDMYAALVRTERMINWMDGDDRAGLVPDGLYEAICAALARANGEG